MISPLRRGRRNARKTRVLYASAMDDKFPPRATGKNSTPARITPLARSSSLLSLISSTQRESTRSVIHFYLSLSLSRSKIGRLQCTRERERENNNRACYVSVRAAPPTFRGGATILRRVYRRRRTRCARPQTRVTVSKSRVNHGSRGKEWGPTSPPSSSSSSTGTPWTLGEN